MMDRHVWWLGGKVTKNISAFYTSNPLRICKSKQNCLQYLEQFQIMSEWCTQLKKIWQTHTHNKEQSQQRQRYLETCLPKDKLALILNTQPWSKNLVLISSVIKFNIEALSKRSSLLHMILLKISGKNCSTSQQQWILASLQLTPVVEEVNSNQQAQVQASEHLNCYITTIHGDFISTTNYFNNNKILYL